MAITTADSYFGAARQRVKIAKTAAITTVAAQLHSLWAAAGDPGAGTLTIGNTTAGVVPTDATAGAPNIKAFGASATGYLATANFRGSVPGGALLVDRLWHAGSIAATALATTTFAAQPSFTTRLPSGTDYGDLEIWIEINAAISATATTVVVGYTDLVGGAGRTTGASASLSGFGSARIVRMPLQAGDKAPTKIDSVTVGGVVATAGSINVMIVRVLAEFDVRIANAIDSQSWDASGSPIVFADSCLMIAAQPDGTSSGTPTCRLTIINA